MNENLNATLSTLGLSFPSSFLELPPNKEKDAGYTEEGNEQQSTVYIEEGSPEN